MDNPKLIDVINLLKQTIDNMQELHNRYQQSPTEVGQLIAAIYKINIGELQRIYQDLLSTEQRILDNWKKLKKR